MAATRGGMEIPTGRAVRLRAQRKANMKFSTYTRTLVAAGIVSAASAIVAEETAQPLLTSLSATTLSGYVDTSAIWLFGTGNNVPGRSFDGSDKQDGFNLNVVSLVLEKPLDESDWAAGYRVQLLFGPDANTIGTTSTMANNGDFALKNAYVELRAPVGNGLTFKVGVWDTVVGYEVFEAGSNPNYSRSYGYYIEPIVHTGVLASYPVADWLTVSAGIADSGGVNTINSRTSVESLFTYLGSVAITAPEGAGVFEGATLYAGVVDAGLDTGKDVVNYYVGGSLPTPLTGVTLGIAYDHRANGVADGSHEDVVGGYLLWEVTEKLRLNGRAEYAVGSNGAYGFTQDGRSELFGLTGTLDYSLWANALTRLEVRWDRDLSNDGEFLKGSAKDAVSLALNVIYQF